MISTSNAESKTSYESKLIPYSHRIVLYKRFLTGMTAHTMHEKNWAKLRQRGRDDNAPEGLSDGGGGRGLHLVLCDEVGEEGEGRGVVAMFWSADAYLDFWVGSLACCKESLQRDRGVDLLHLLCRVDNLGCGAFYLRRFELRPYVFNVTASCTNP
jgi:hypothetical protein